MKVIHSEDTWLGHVQFSPTDPNILMFCHEGPWHKVDRIWRYDVKDGSVTLMHKRSMPMEIAGHEFFAPDGKSIWFDLQQPRGKTFYLAGADVRTGAEIGRYQMTANEWSIHYAMTPGGTLFAGDGGDPTQVAHAQDGMWIQAFHPDGAWFRPLLALAEHSRADWRPRGRTRRRRPRRPRPHSRSAQCRWPCIHTSA
jgi:oligogalacturonide lyase